MKGYRPLSNLEIETELNTIASRMTGLFWDDEVIHEALDRLVANTEGLTVKALHAVIQADEDGSAFLDTRTMIAMKALGMLVANQYYPASAK